MNSEEMMRAIDFVIRDLVIHIQELEAENKKMRDKIDQQSIQLAEAADSAKRSFFEKSRMDQRMKDASKYIKAACQDDDGLSGRTIRRLWKALDVLGI